MLHIPLILAVKAAQLAYRNRDLIAEGVRTLQTEASPHTSAVDTDHRKHDTPAPSVQEEPHRSEADSVTQIEADARAEHCANMHAMTAGMKAWATKPRAW